MSTPAVSIQDRPPLPVAEQACCMPLLREPLTASRAADLSHKLKALADPTRLQLVSMVAAHEGGEACVCDLTEPLGLTQPKLAIFGRESLASTPTPRAPRRQRAPSS